MRILVGLCLAIFSFSSLAAAIPDSPHVYVKGRGKISVLPDLAEISFSVIRRHSDLIQAKKEADTLSANIIKIAEEYEIAKEDISASELFIQQEMQYDREAGKQVITGFKVSRNIQFYLKKIDLYSRLMQSLVNAGITQINGIRMMASNAEDLQKQAQKLAIADARAAAEELADGFEVKIARLYRAAKEPIRGEQPYATMESMRDSAPANIVEGAFEPGSITIEQVLYAVYLIE
ncbi:SIMPL domain-containing protein [Thalassomonas actiniarum]|uniref:SIMPL domain-containing protein n=1 Tax=Thalassomonas actiniarum TaxID=485447 RepID=A0AAE9YQK0_9GAMM|nr:SIMPL domain-containing protein [Thalassomonas actiniarum]WDD99240.1 SIMPL domain-containing protein [Thalassomonas actiniarum]